MEENTSADDETPDIERDVDAVNKAEETVSAIGTSGTTQNIQPEKMEVHHHPNVERRGVKEYLLEGLMIFLAVTLGFFAENLRENIKDSKAVRQSMKSLRDDLKSDVTMYDSSIAINLTNCRMIDTLISLLTEKRETGKIYLLARRLTIGAGIFTPSSKTFEQLKSTGYLRLIENQNILDSINTYYQLMKFFDYWTGLQRQRINDVIEGNDKVFDGKVFFSIYKGFEKSGGSSLEAPAGNPSLLTNDPVMINSVIIRYQYFYGVLKIVNRKAVEASDEASRLVVILQKEYSLE